MSQQFANESIDQMPEACGVDLFDLETFGQLADHHFDEPPPRYHNYIGLLRKLGKMEGEIKANLGDPFG